MFTRRTSDEDWVKYLLNTGLTTVDHYQAMRGGKNQVDITEMISQNATLFDNDLWVNRALQQDRFHYIPEREIIAGEIEALRQLQPLLLSRCLNEQILPLSYSQPDTCIWGFCATTLSSPSCGRFSKACPSTSWFAWSRWGRQTLPAFFPQVKSMIQR